MIDNEAIKLAPIKSCTGCMACGDICPKGCITFFYGEEGFWYPQIDHSACVHCRACQRACPIITPVEFSKDMPKAFAAWADRIVRKDSASGGVFYALASKVIREGGYVCGAIFEENHVKHIITNSMNDLHRIQGTKYFQSNTHGIYRKVKNLLIMGYKILFSGTSCQVAGLYNVVGRNNENLITIDLICFGVPSPLTINVEERMRGKKLKRIINSRDKKHEGGWRNAYWMTCEWNDGTTTVSSLKESFMLGSFCSGKVMRKSCYHCPFKTISRQSDLTIGDYHCIKDFEEQKSDGISLVLVQSEKGLIELFSTKTLTIYERDIKESLPYKRTIYYNDTMYEKRLVRRYMPFLLRNAPLWLLKLMYQNIIKSNNPLVWPLTFIDALYVSLNNFYAKRKLKKIKY